MGDSNLNTKQIKKSLIRIADETISWDGEKQSIIRPKLYSAEPQLTRRNADVKKGAKVKTKKAKVKS